MSDYEEEDYLDSEEERETVEAERGIRDPTIQNVYGMNKFMLDPESKKKFKDVLTKDVVLSNLDPTELRIFREWMDIWYGFEDMIRYYPELQRNADMIHAKLAALLTSSRGKNGFAAQLATTQILEQRRYMKSEREKRDTSGGLLQGFFKKKKRYRGGF